jgi:hypothetical protein
MKIPKQLFTIALPLFTAAALNLATLFAADSTPNQLSEEDKKGGWKLLFDGKTTNGWRGAKQKTFPAKGWEIQDGWLHCLGKGGGDIVTEGAYDEFELKWEWKQAEAGNSGVKYFVTEKGSTIGHEYQLIDDDKHPDAKLANGKRVTASFYDVLKPERPPPTKKPGEINNSRIVVKGNGVEHWLNGEKVLSYSCSSEAIKQAIAQSKFKNAKDFDARIKGPILLQDHESEIWFRNIEIRDQSGADKPGAKP